MLEEDYLNLLYPKGKEAKSPRNIQSDDGFIFIDPGLTGTGIAIFEQLHGMDEWPDVPRNINVKGIVGKGKDWVARAQDTVEQVEKFCDAATLMNTINKKKYVVVIEMPGLWGGNAVSYAASATGGLFKLAVLVGMLGNELIYDALVHPPPMRWKGQLSKEAVRKRLVRATGRKARWPDHVEDAVGMGISAQGRL